MLFFKLESEHYLLAFEYFSVFRHLLFPLQAYLMDFNVESHLGCLYILFFELDVCAAVSWLQSASYFLYIYIYMFFYFAAKGSTYVFLL